MEKDVVDGEGRGRRKRGGWRLAINVGPFTVQPFLRVGPVALASVSPNNKPIQRPLQLLI